MGDSKGKLLTVKSRTRRVKMEGVALKCCRRGGNKERSTTAKRLCVGALPRASRTTTRLRTERNAGRVDKDRLEHKKT